MENLADLARLSRQTHIPVAYPPSRPQKKHTTFYTIFIIALFGLLGIGCLCATLATTPHDPHRLVDPDPPAYCTLFWFSGVLLLVVAGFTMFATAFCLPSTIAQRRHHPNATAITVCTGCSLIFPLLWFVAVIWAHTGPDYSKLQHPYA